MINLLAGILLFFIIAPIIGYIVIWIGGSLLAGIGLFIYRIIYRT